MNLRGLNGGSVRRQLRDLEGAAREAVEDAVRALAKDARAGIRLP